MKAFNNETCQYLDSGGVSWTIDPNGDENDVQPSNRWHSANDFHCSVGFAAALGADDGAVLLLMLRTAAHQDENAAHRIPSAAADGARAHGPRHY